MLETVVSLSLVIFELMLSTGKAVLRLPESYYIVALFRGVRGRGKAAGGNRLKAVTQ